MKKKTPSIESIDRTLGRTGEWLTELSQQLDSDDTEEVCATFRAVLRALRDRLPLIASVRLGAQLPTLLRGVYYEGWQPDRGHVHTRSLAEFFALVERDAPHGTEISAEDQVRAVFRLLVAKLDAPELARVIDALPVAVRPLFPRPGPGGERSVVNMRVPPAKTA